MTRHEQLVENYENALFELLMEGVIEREGEQIEKENEQLKNDPDFAIPPELDKRCMASIKKACRRRRRGQFGRKAYGVLSKVAVVVLVVLVLFTSAYAAFPSVTAGIMNLIIEVSDVATTLRMEDTMPADLMSGGEVSLGDYTYSGIPDEFTLMSSNETSVSSMNYYENSFGAYICISILQGLNSLHNVNTENAASVSEITVAGYTGLLIVREDVTILALADTDAGMFITLYSDCLGETGLLEIAKTLTYSGVT